MEFITLEEFLLESNNNNNIIYWLTTVDSKTDNLTIEARKLFEIVYIKETSKKKIDSMKFQFDKPMLYGGGINKVGIELNDKWNTNTKSKIFVYNDDPFETTKSSNKVKFHKLMEGFNFIPKTVFTIKDTKDLKFPIVAKPSKGKGGVGIEKFDNKEELLKSKNKFDLFSEAIDFENEFRALYLGDKLITVSERIHNVDKNKTLKTKDVNEEIEFVYITQDLSKIPFKKELNNIHNKIKSKIDLQFYAIDFVMDKNGKLWVLEINSNPGLGAEKVCIVYENIYKQFYGSLPKEIKTKIKTILNKSRNLDSKNYKKEIKLSKFPISYNSL